MDTSSINRTDLTPFATLPVTAMPAPASAQASDTDTAPAIVAAKDDTGSRTQSKTELKKSVDAINRALENNSQVRFSIDESTGLSVVKVIDTETKKVLHQYPSEQSLEIGKKLDSLKGLVIDSQA